MAVVIEPEFWQPEPAAYIFLFSSCFFSIFLHPRFSKGKTSPTLFDHSASSSFPGFQRKFLIFYSLASVIEGLWSVFGEFELAYYGINREERVLSLCVGCAAALFVGTCLGIISDLIGQKKACLIFCILHFFVGMWKRITLHPSVWVATICLSLATSIFSFSFETWMVVEHDKQGHRKDALSDTFWLMTFFESAFLIGSQVLANWLVGSDVEKSIASLCIAAKILALVGICYACRGWTENPSEATLKDYKTSFYTYIFCDKRIWLLMLAQACLQFSVAVFWILWAPTLVADGRDVRFGLVYPCLLGARMLGSTVFPWLISGPLSLRFEVYLVYALVAMGFVISLVAYDYQEIGYLVTLFCLFHVCAGLIAPSLARLRSIYVPNELRGGMISLSLAPANVALLFFIVQGGYYRNIGNTTILAFAAFSLFIAAACIHMLKQSGKQPFQKKAQVINCNSDSSATSPLMGVFSYQFMERLHKSNADL